LTFQCPWKGNKIQCAGLLSEFSDTKSLKCKYLFYVEAVEAHSQLKGKAVVFCEFDSITPV